MSDAEASAVVAQVVRTTEKMAKADVAAAPLVSTTTQHASHLRDVHRRLIDAYGDLSRALDATESTLENIDDGVETPKQIIGEHGDRLKEQYDGPVLYLALQLLEANRREWLHQKTSTNGADAVRRHGLTENQRTWLNACQTALDQSDVDVMEP